MVRTGGSQPGAALVVPQGLRRKYSPGGFRAMGAALGLLLLGPVTAWALVIRPLPASERLVQSEVVVAGRVLSLEQQTVSAPPTPQAKDSFTYRIAIIRIQERIKGDKLPDTIRLGFPAPAETTPKQPDRVPRPGGVAPVPMVRKRWGLNLSPGDEGLFYLRKHPSGLFYEAATFGSFTSSQNPQFLMEYQAVKRAAQLLADPLAGLQASRAADRLLTAHLLLLQYHQPPPGGAVRKEPLDAEQSRLILKAILEADWAPAPRHPGAAEPTPQQVFYQLGLSPQDGWRPPTASNPQQVNEAMQAWLRSHLDTYRVQRYIPLPSRASGDR
jgi:hypothetical protein